MSCAFQGLHDKVDKVTHQVGDIKSKVDSVLSHVITIEERTLKLAALPDQLQAGLQRVRENIKGVQDVVMKVGWVGSEV